MTMKIPKGTRYSALPLGSTILLPNRILIKTGKSKGALKLTRGVVSIGSAPTLGSSVTIRVNLKKITFIPLDFVE